MKKFAVIASIGNHNLINGHGSIECTVKDVELVADSDNREELVNVLIEKSGKAYGGTVYAEDGKWYSYSVQMRKHARQTLKQYGKL